MRLRRHLGDGILNVGAAVAWTALGWDDGCAGSSRRRRRNGRNGSRCC